MSGRRYATLAPGFPHRPGRERQWKEVLGESPVPLRPGGPHLARLPIGLRLVYEIDLDALGDDAVKRLAEQQARMDRMSVTDALKLMWAEGLPILAEGLIVFDGEGGGD